MKPMAHFKMKFKSCFLFFFFMEIYSAVRFSTVQFATKGPHLRRTSPHVNLPHSNHVHQRQVPNQLNRTWNYMISKNPPQRLNVLFDTGSFEAWLLSKRYDNCDPNWAKIQSKHKLYDFNISSTFFGRVDSRPLLMTYLDEWVFGYKARDVTTVLGFEFNKTFLEVVKASAELTNMKIDGVVGLQYDPKQGNSISKACAARGQQNIFSFYYPKKERHIGGGGGILTLCGSDNSQYNFKTAHYISTIVPGTWFVPLQGVVLHDKRGSVKIVSQPTKLQIQTDLFYILAPESSIKYLLELLTPYFPSGRVHTQDFDCKHVHLLPSLTFQIEGKNYTLTGAEYTRGIEGMENHCRFDLDVNPSDFWSVGDGFIANYHTTFDMENHRVIMSESIQY